MTENLPTTLSSAPASSRAMMIMLDDKMFERAKWMAHTLSQARGFAPPHLIDNTHACFAVVMNAITWNMNPFSVGQATYQTPGGKVGYEGKLCQAIVENSGQIEGGVTYEEYGNWSKVQGKFELRTSDKGKKYAVGTYTDKDEEGLGVIVRAQVKRETTPREYRMDLRQAHPRNSTLWATDPLTQLKYRAVRGFCNIAVPGIFMGVPIGDDLVDEETIKNVTPINPKTSSINDALLKAAEQAPVPKNEAVQPVVAKTATPDHVEDQLEMVADHFADVSKMVPPNHTGETAEMVVKPAEIPIPVHKLPMLYDDQGVIIETDWQGFAVMMSKTLKTAPSRDWMARYYKKYESQLNSLKSKEQQAFEMIENTKKVRWEQLK